MGAFNWITEFVCGLGIIMGLAWLLNKNWWFVRAHYLALYLLFFCLILLEQNLYWTTFYIEYPHFLLLTDPIALMLGPLLFFYESRRSLKNNWLHFAPAIAILLAYLPIYLLGPVEKVEFIKRTIWNGQDINALQFIAFRVLLLVQIIGYGFYIQSRRKFNWGIKNIFSIKTPLEQLILASYFLFGAVKLAWLAFTLFSNYIYIDIFDTCIRLVTMLSVFYLFINVINKIKVGSRRGEIYEKSFIENGEAVQLKERLSHFMDETEPYLNRNLKMVEIASHLNISEHKLSQLLNVHLGTNFFEYVNKYRISKARLLLKNPDYNRYTIETIAKECGFNSKSTFNEAFKKIEGVTPSVFKKH
ncbi:MAG: helix-turn-helix transcriptional regulator [Cyclobacteriaceae bacterium]